MKSEIRKESNLKLLKKVDEAAKIALFYGFLPIEPPKITREDLEVASEFDGEWHPEEKAAILRDLYQLRSVPQPFMIFYQRRGKKNNIMDCELAILGSQRSVCESILIQTTKSILENTGWREISARINSVGSKDSVAEFERKISAFVRKRMAEFPAELRQNLKKDIHYLTKSREARPNDGVGQEKYKELKESLPQSVDYLSEGSRLHLKEILEFLETIEIPYMMDSSLIGDLKYTTETVFEIISDLDGEVLARGLRWNRLSKKIDNKKEVPAVSVSIEAKTMRARKMTIIKKPNPRFYLIQFGPEAKNKSFLVLEKLRKAGIAVLHSLAKDKLTGQIFSAEQAGMPYTILIGQKEAIDNVVMIRNTATRVQYIVPINELPEFIKKSDEFK